MGEISRVAIIYKDDTRESRPALIDLDELHSAMRPERYAELVSDLDMACRDALARRGEHGTPVTVERLK